MRGSPVFRAIVVIVLLLLAAIPLWRLTHAAGVASMDSAPVAPAAAARVHIELTFAHAPSGFQVLHLGKVIWEAKQSGETAQKDIPMEFPKEGIDLEIKADWPPATPLTAVRAVVTHGETPIEKTVWGRGSLDEVMTFIDPQ
jgi:hypothetical protein